jgi:GAF domain-containing protein
VHTVPESFAVPEPPSFRRKSSPHLEALLRETERRLRKQNSVLVELARRPSIHSGNLAEALSDIAEAAAETLEVERVGVWFFTPDRQAIRCAELFERTPRTHSGGGELTAMRYPIYFNALETERVIAAHDARFDPRTSAFTKSYLDPFGVTSMLDASIRRVGHMAGVLCFEHTGPERSWTIEEENFATSLADLVAMAVDATERRQAQEALRHRVEFEQLIAGMSSRFMNIGDDELEETIVHVLAEVGSFVGAESAHVFLISDDRLSARMVHEWDAPGIPPRKEKYGDLPAAAFPWWMGRIDVQRENVAVTSPDELPPEAVNERRLFERYGVRSALFVPMIVKKRVIGSVGASLLTREMRWSDETISLLRTTGEIIASASWPVTSRPNCSGAPWPSSWSRTTVTCSTAPRRSSRRALTRRARSAIARVARTARTSGSRPPAGPSATPPARWRRSCRSRATSASDARPRRRSSIRRTTMR